MARISESVIDVLDTLEVGEGGYELMALRRVGRVLFEKSCSAHPTQYLDLGHLVWATNLAEPDVVKVLDALTTSGMATGHQMVPGETGWRLTDQGRRAWEHDKFGTVPPAARRFCANLHMDRAGRIYQANWNLMRYWYGVDAGGTMEDTAHTGRHDTREQGMDQSKVAELEAWWEKTARDEAMAVIPKAIEYGADELREMGRILARSQGIDDVDDARATELAIWFYALGKMQRWTAAVVRGEQVSDDTLHDLGVYARMTQRVRSCGGWPS